MRVTYSELSINDLSEIADYLVDNVGAIVANKGIGEIERVIVEVLSENPDIGTAVLHEIEGILFFPAGQYPVYQIFYKKRNDVLDVYRVLHGKRDIKSLL